jgi:hypothetical protein
LCDTTNEESVVCKSQLAAFKSSAGENCRTLQQWILRCSSFPMFNNAKQAGTNDSNATKGSQLWRRFLNIQGEQTGVVALMNESRKCAGRLERSHGPLKLRVQAQRRKGKPGRGPRPVSQVPTGFGMRGLRAKLPMQTKAEGGGVGEPVHGWPLALFLTSHRYVPRRARHLHACYRLLYSRKEIQLCSMEAMRRLTYATTPESSTFAGIDGN